MRLLARIALMSPLICVLCWGQDSNRAATTRPDPVAATKAGKVRGSMTADGVAVFKNIPFAQAPTGNLRWKEPVPAEPWAGIRDATVFGPACYQSGHLNATSSEDCLQLNVWTPKWPMKSRVPVMVWFHGGGNIAGSGVEPLFNGESLARHGVVLVTSNYRLGIFGFFAHPELSKESPHDASGNYGLLDQIQALRWVRDNIAKFGGDPANVTIFGESAGSMDVNVLMTTPLSKGLFRRVIAESGAVGDAQPLTDAEKRGEGIAAKLGIAGEGALPKLRALSSADLQKGAEQGPMSGGPLLGIDVDGWVLPESPAKVFAEGKEHPVGLLFGNNSQELQHPFGPMAKGLRETITERFGPLADQALALYGLNGASEPAPDPEFGSVMAQWSTDTTFRCSTIQELIWHSTAGNPSYEYQFSRTHHRKPAEGASHASEIPFVFGTLAVWQDDRHYNDADKAASEQMAEYWTNFAKTGDPNGGNLPQWQKFDATVRAYLDFTDAGPAGKDGLRRPICDLYMENQKRQMVK